MQINRVNINPSISATQKGDRLGHKETYGNPTIGSDNARHKNEDIVQNDIKKVLEIPRIVSYKAFFDIDENKNVVIKIVDSEGNLVRQIPPEEYIKMAESFKENIKNLFHIEV